MPMPVSLTEKRNLHMVWRSAAGRIQAFEAQHHLAAVR